MPSHKKRAILAQAQTQAAWQRISEAVVRWVGRGGKHGAQVVAPAQVSIADVKAAMEAQLLWAREEMRSGEFNQVRLWGLGTFVPMTRNFAKYMATKDALKLAEPVEQVVEVAAMGERGRGTASYQPNPEYVRLRAMLSDELAEQGITLSGLEQEMLRFAQGGPGPAGVDAEGSTIFGA